MAVLFLPAAALAGASAQTPEQEIVWRSPVQVASGEAKRGPWRMNESDYRWVDDPTVVLDSDGDAAIAWVDQARKDVFFQVYSRDNEPVLESPTNVSRSAGIFSWMPRAVIDPSEPAHIYILWQEIIFSGGTHGGEIMFARSGDGGRSFSEPLNLSRTKAGAGKGRLTQEHWHNGSLDLVVDDNGDLFAAWTEYQGPLRVAYSSDGGVTFSEPVYVSGNARAPARGPSLALDEENVHLAWTIGESEDASIHFASAKKDELSFEAPRLVQQSRGHADAPKLAVDDAGTLHLVYGESPAGPYDYYDVRYTRYAAGDEGFEPVRTLSRNRGEIQSANFPHLAVANGNVYVAWERFPDHDGQPRGLAFTWSSNGGDDFRDPCELRDSEEHRGVNGSQQGLLMDKLAANREAEIAVVNSRFIENEASRIWLYRGEVVSRATSR